MPIHSTRPSKKVKMHSETVVEANPNLVRIDHRLHTLVQHIELLNYVNPINIEQ